MTLSPSQAAAASRTLPAPLSGRVHLPPPSARDTHRARAVGTGSPKGLAEGQSVGQE